MIKPDGVILKFTGPDGEAVEWRLRLTWTSLLALRDTWGEGFELRVENAWANRVLPDLAVIVELAGGPTPLETTRLSPPVIDLGERLRVCWNWAYRGYEAAETFAAAMQAEAERQAKEAARGHVKKFSLSRFFSSFAMRWRTPSAQA